MVADELPDIDIVAVSRRVVLASVRGVFASVRLCGDDRLSVGNFLLAPAVREHLVVLFHMASLDWVSPSIELSIKNHARTMHAAFTVPYIPTCGAQTKSQQILPLQIVNL